MTICFAQRYRSDRSSQDWALIHTDSLMTVTGPVKDQGAWSPKTFVLPTNLAIRHTDPHATKLHIINRAGHHGRQVVGCVAGAVAQGLHGLLHLDASLQPISTEISGREAFIKRCYDVLERFWATAYDKDIDYLLTCREPTGDVHMVKFCGTSQSFTRVDVSEDRSSGLLLACIGDQHEVCVDGILSETNLIATVKPHIKLDYALDIAITRMLRRRIADENDRTVGGYPNMAIIDDDDARYAYVIQDQDHAFFRGLPLTRSDLPLVPQPHYHHDWRREPLYDPAVQIG